MREDQAAALLATLGRLADALEAIAPPRIECRPPTVDDDNLRRYAAAILCPRGDAMTPEDRAAALRGSRLPSSPAKGAGPGPQPPISTSPGHDGDPHP